MIPQRRSAILSAPLRPTWSWDFTRGALPPGAAFSRTSPATQFDASGTLRWAAENRVTWSQDFSQSIWGKYGGGTGSVPVVTQNDATTLAPDGTQTAAKVVFACGGGTTLSDNSILQYTGGSSSAVIGRPYTGFIRVKAAAGTQLVFRHVGLSAYTLFTATGGWDTVSTDEAAGGIQLNLEIGLRQGLFGTINAGATAWVWGAQVHGKPNADATYHPTAGGAFYGCRFDHDPLTGAALGYLAEMQSTNSIFRSEEFDNVVAWNADGARTTVSANVATAPDGNLTADKLIPSAANTYHDIYNNVAVTVVANAPFGLSVFAKAVELSAVTLNVFGSNSTKWVSVTFNLSSGTVSKSAAGAGGTLVSSNIRAIGNGWYRIAFIGSINDTTANFLVEANNTTNPTYSSWGLSTGYAGNASDGLLLWGAQFEAGGVGVTSYIPTAGAAATRSADNLATPLSAVPGWNGSAGGAFAAAGRLYTIYPPLPGFNQMPVWINNAGDYRNAVGVEFDNGGSGQRGVFMYSGGAGAYIGSNFGAVSAPFVRSKIVVGWQANRIAAAYDGANQFAQAGTLALPVGPTTLNIGLYIGSHAFGGAIDSIAYYAGARSDALVQRASR